MKMLIMKRRGVGIKLGKKTNPLVKTVPFTLHKRSQRNAIIIALNIRDEKQGAAEKDFVISTYFQIPSQFVFILKN